MKYIGLDYGTRKCGLAVSDDRGMVAVPWKIVATGELENELSEMLKNEKFKRIVIGESVKSDGTHNEVFAKVEEFIKMLSDKYFKEIEAGNLELILEKEFFSSKHARISDGKQEVDDRAAALILQRFLDKQAVRDGRNVEEELDEEDGL
jgi:putative Holliday junction resolvase